MLLSLLSTPYDSTATSATARPVRHIFTSNGALEGSVAWTSVSGYGLEVTITRGRGSDLMPYSAGTANIVLDNRDRVVEGQFDPMDRVSVQVSWNGHTWSLFDGSVDSLAFVYEKPNQAQVVLNATDGFKILERMLLAESVWEAWIRNETTTPRAWWRLGEPTGSTTYIDQGTGSYHGTVTGAPTATSSVPVREPDGATKWDGVDDYLELPATAGPQGTSWTVECWVSLPSYSDTTNVATIYAQGHAGAASTFLGVRSADIASSPGRAHASVNGTALTGTSNVLDTERAHLALTRSGSTVTLYVNGVAEDTDTLSTTTAIAGGETRIAKNITAAGGSILFPGVIDELLVWDTALTAAQILDHHDSGSSPLSGDDPQDRIEQILTWAGWPAHLQAIEEGTSTLQSTSLGGSAAEYLRKVALSENGDVFLDRSGRVTFLPRTQHMAPSTNSVATFGDSGSELGYTELELVYDDQDVANYIRISREGGVAQIAEDATSQTSFLVHRLEREGLLYDNDEESHHHAHYLKALYDEPSLRVVGITIDPDADPSNLYPQVLGREIGDRITVVRRPPGGGSAISQVSIIEGITHRIGIKTWETTWRLSSARAATSFWKLGTSGFSEVGTTTRVGY